jgi:hypothetical protein
MRDIILIRIANRYHKPSMQIQITVDIFAPLSSMIIIVLGNYERIIRNSKP